MAEWREAVEVPDVPFYWNSVLTDNRIRSLYQALLEGRFFLGLQPSSGLQYEGGMPVIRFGMRLKETVLEFEGQPWRVLLTGETVIVEPWSAAADDVEDDSRAWSETSSHTGV